MVQANPMLEMLRRLWKDFESGKGRRVITEEEAQASALRTRCERLLKRYGVFDMDPIYHIRLRHPVPVFIDGREGNIMISTSPGDKLSDVDYIRVYDMDLPYWGLRLHDGLAVEGTPNMRGGTMLKPATKEDLLLYKKMVDSVEQRFSRRQEGKDG